MVGMRRKEKLKVFQVHKLKINQVKTRKRRFFGDFICLLLFLDRDSCNQNFLVNCSVAFSVFWTQSSTNRITFCHNLSQDFSYRTSEKFFFAKEKLLEQLKLIFICNNKFFHAPIVSFRAVICDSLLVGIFNQDKSHGAAENMNFLTVILML